ncbi:hypothetical protein HanIR_Chr13g0645401 [Helianthus annuus]|nr:hypothetical protein HanIR_Chr13g0645401 [Helianthus annuus]
MPVVDWTGEEREGGWAVDGSCRLYSDLSKGCERLISARFGGE